MSIRFSACFEIGRSSSVGDLELSVLAVLQTRRGWGCRLTGEAPSGHTVIATGLCVVIIATKRHESCFRVTPVPTCKGAGGFASWSEGVEGAPQLGTPCALGAR